MKALAISGAFIPHCSVYVLCLSGLLIQRLIMSFSGKVCLMFVYPFIRILSCWISLAKAEFALFRVFGLSCCLWFRMLFLGFVR